MGVIVVLLKDEVTADEKLTERGSLIVREGVTVCNALVENVRLLLDGKGVPLFVSEEKMKTVKNLCKETHLLST